MLRGIIKAFRKPVDEVVPVVLHSFDTILLKDFEECCATHDYSRLIISGNPSLQQISDAWEAILLTYHDKTTNKLDRGDFTLQQKLTDIDTFVYMTNVLVSLLRFGGYNAKLVESLYILGHNDCEITPDNMLERFEAISAYAAGKELEAAPIRVQVKELNEKAAADQKRTDVRENLNIMKVRLVKYTRTDLDFQKMLLSHFCIHVRDFVDYIRKQQDKRNRNGRPENRSDVLEEPGY